MLRKLRLQSYRCFDDHTVTFQPSTVVVGRNNAGKSTIVEALHIIATVVNRKAASFTTPPSGTGLNRFNKGIAPKIDHLNLNLKTAFHRYGEPPAVISATFEGGAVVTAYVHKEGVFATLSGAKGWVTTSAGFLALGIPPIHILPQVAPLQTEEERLNDDYISKNYYTHLSSRHFRNQMHRSPGGFDRFKTLAEQTWQGLRVDSVNQSGPILELIVTDGDFAAEAAWMGHGLQMWLQTIWFIAKTPTESTVVLDEPDVYMHPDLQRKLYRLVKNRFAQAIIATHSVEIMAEADPADILIINNKKRKSEYANTEPAVQVLIDQLGGIHNVHLARLWSARRVILVEGKDLGFLKTFHALLYPQAQTPLDAIPNLSIGGWGGWRDGIGSTMGIKNAVGDHIAFYCIFDSDYHTSTEIEERYKQAQTRGINLHIWERKEIENYLIEPDVIARLIKQRAKKASPTRDEVRKFLLAACEEEKDTVLDGIASLQDRSLGVGGANKKAREYVNARWTAERLHIVSGKALLSRLNEWTREQYGVTVGAMAIAKAFRAGELPGEIRQVITSIEEVTPLKEKATTRP